MQKEKKIWGRARSCWGQPLNENKKRIEVSNFVNYLEVIREQNLAFNSIFVI